MGLHELKLSLHSSAQQWATEPTEFPHLHCKCCLEFCWCVQSTTALCSQPVMHPWRMLMMPGAIIYWWCSKHVSGVRLCAVTAVSPWPCTVALIHAAQSYAESWCFTNMNNKCFQTAFYPPIYYLKHMVQVTGLRCPWATGRVYTSSVSQWLSSIQLPLTTFLGSQMNLRGMWIVCNLQQRC